MVERVQFWCDSGLVSITIYNTHTHIVKKMHYLVVVKQKGTYVERVYCVCVTCIGRSDRHNGDESSSL